MSEKSKSKMDELGRRREYFANKAKEELEENTKSIENFVDRLKERRAEIQDKDK
tara:strand:+ start:646 stop:807 length:162 start_codon:yes stop_codon:yes gene_type:complete